MAPAQCPECGRFLSKTFVASLTVESADCPKCETLLTATQFGLDQSEGVTTPKDRDEEPAQAAALRAEPPVATPSPAPVREVLADWDQGGASVHDLDAHRGGNGAPPDAAILGGAGVAGLLVGLVVSDRRGRGGLIGLILGLLAAAVAKKVWVLDDQA